MEAAFLGCLAAVGSLGWVLAVVWHLHEALAPLFVFFVFWAFLLGIFNHAVSLFLS